MFKFLNGTVVFTGFNGVENLYVRRLAHNAEFEKFDEKFVVGPEMNIAAMFDTLKECNFTYDKPSYFCTNDTADSAREALDMKDASIYDDTPLMIYTEEFNFPDSRGAGHVYLIMKRAWVVAHYDEDKDENGELFDDAESCFTPIELFCYGIRRHGEEDIKLITAFQHGRMFRTNKLTVFALNLVEPLSFLATHHHEYVAFDEEGRAFISEPNTGPTGENSPEFITAVLEGCKFKPFDHLTGHLTFCRDEVCVIYGDYPIRMEDFTADKFLNVVNAGRYKDWLTATELKNYYAMFDDDGIAKIVFHHEDGTPWF